MDKIIGELARVKAIFQQRSILAALGVKVSKGMPLEDEAESLRHYRWQQLKPRSMGDFIVNWQPIETAPRDGIKILGYSPYAYEVSSIHWVKSQSGLGGFWEGSAFTRTNPTHWMPLPPPPEPKS